MTDPIDAQPDQEVVATAEFYNDAARFERDRKKPELIAKNRRQAKAALRLCGDLPKDANIVDFPCGPGHHTDYILDQGYANITAIEGSQAHVDGLKNDPKYDAYPVKPTFKHAFYQELNDDAKTVPNESTDAFFCFGESWGFMPTLKENEEHLKKMYDKVKPGGTLVIQGRYTPSSYFLDGNGVPQMRNNPSRDLKKGESRAEDGATWYSAEDFNPVENYIPKEFAPDLEDRFRKLGVTNYYAGTPKVDADGVPATMKIAGYFVPKVDQRNRPVDYPVMRAFCSKLGMTDITFHSQLDSHDGHRVEPYYICSMVIKKPSNEQVEDIGEEVHARVRDAQSAEAMKEHVELSRLDPTDVTDAELRQIVDNLLSVTFLPENIQKEELRMRLKDRINKSRDATESPLEKSILRLRGTKIYPGYTRGFLLEMGLAGLAKLIQAGQVWGIRVDRKLVSIAAYKESHNGKMPDGRTIFELSKASTLKEYEGRGYLTRLQTTILDHLKTLDPNAVIISSSRNPRAIKHFEKTGFKAYDFADQHVIGVDMQKVMTDPNLDPEMRREYEKMVETGYKFLVFDPMAQ